MNSDCDGIIPADEVDADSDGYRVYAGDCDDDEPAVHPGVWGDCDGLDNDCDPLTDEEVDGDGDEASVCGGDCDDLDAEVNILDVDGDGMDSCSGDCDDSDPWVFLGGCFVYLILGPFTGDLDTDLADATYHCEGEHGVGSVLAGAGSVDGNEYADILVGAPDYSGVAGAAYLVLGGP